MPLGFVWRIAWWSPYTQPPEGMPRVLVEMYVPCRDPHEGARCPAEIAAYPKPRGYALECGSIDQIGERSSPEKLARIRRQRLVRRVQRKYPLFVDEFIGQALAAKPDYYAGADDDRAVEYLRRYRAWVDEVISRPYVLVEYAPDGMKAAGCLP